MLKKEHIQDKCRKRRNRNLRRVGRRGVGSAWVAVGRGRRRGQPLEWHSVCLSPTRLTSHRQPRTQNYSHEEKQIFETPYRRDLSNGCLCPPAGGCRVNRTNQGWNSPFLIGHHGHFGNIAQRCCSD